MCATFEAIGSVPELVVPDNAKTAVVKPSFYDPEINRTYAEMAVHCGTTAKLLPRGRGSRATRRKSSRPS